jgi:hypothetical protein
MLTKWLLSAKILRFSILRYRIADPSPYQAEDPELNPFKNVLESSILDQTPKVRRKLTNSLVICCSLCQGSGSLMLTYPMIRIRSKIFVVKNVFRFGFAQYVLSVISAIVAEFVTYPLDLTKTRLQIQVIFLCILLLFSLDTEDVKTGYFFVFRIRNILGLVDPTSNNKPRFL